MVFEGGCRLNDLLHAHTGCMFWYGEQHGPEDIMLYVRSVSGWDKHHKYVQRDSAGCLSSLDLRMKYISSLETRLVFIGKIHILSIAISDVPKLYLDLIKPNVLAGAPGMVGVVHISSILVMAYVYGAKSPARSMIIRSLAIIPAIISVK